MLKDSEEVRVKPNPAASVNKGSDESRSLLAFILCFYGRITVVTFWDGFQLYLNTFVFTLKLKKAHLHVLISIVGAVTQEKLLYYTL